MVSLMQLFLLEEERDPDVLQEYMAAFARINRQLNVIEGITLGYISFVMVIRIIGVIRVIRVIR
jgi:hypothetical protein